MEGNVDYQNDPNLKGYCNYCFQEWPNGADSNETTTTLSITTEDSLYDDDYINENLAADNITEEDQNALCETAKGIDNILLDRVILLPALALVICIAFFLQRKYLMKNVLKGRPGLVYPLNLLEGQQHRFSFVAGFVLVSLPMFNMIIFTSGSAKKLPYYDDEMQPYMKSFYIFAACLMKALEFYPIFATLTAHNLFAFGTGSLYVWTLMITFAMDDRFCFSGTKPVRAIQMCRLIPPIVCMIYLSIYFPFRFIKCLMLKFTNEKGEVIHKSWEQPHNVVYVKELLNKHKVIYVPPKKLIDKIKYKVYCPFPTFKYSICILTAVFTGLCFTYMAALAQLEGMYNAIEGAKKYLRVAVKAKKMAASWIGPATVLFLFFGFDDIESAYRGLLKEVVFWMNWIIEPLVYLSLSLGFVSVVTSMLLTMKNYRNNLLAIYRNQNEELQKRSTLKPRGILVSGVKYVGYQISYAAWGYLIQTIIISLIGLFIATILMFMIRYKLYKQMIMWAINKFWCMLTVIIMLMLTQNLLAHFVFLRKGDDGHKVLALNNRRFFFNFHYFAVFTNIAVGLLSCILRIFRACFFGLWTVPRLDMSTMNREFERLDAGYMSYVCLMYLEHTQRNPTMLVFVKLLTECTNSGSNTGKDMDMGKKKFLAKSSAAFKRVRTRYHLWLTLERNPGLRLYRKSSPILPDLLQMDKTKDPQKKSFFDKLNSKSLVVPYVKVYDKSEQTKC